MDVTDLQPLPDAHAPVITLLLLCLEVQIFLFFFSVWLL